MLRVSRRFDASPERVFDAWLDAKAVGRWLFATPEGKMQTVEVEPRVGGVLRIVEKRGDQLADHVGRFLELERPRRLVFSFATEPGQTPTRVSVRIEPDGDGCVLELSHELDPQWAAYEDRARDGWAMILENLHVTLSGGRTIRVERTFDAPRALVWRAWTDVAQIAQWMCPTECQILACEGDMRVGGRYRESMRCGERVHTVSGVYREIRPESRLVFTHQWDEPFAAETEVTVELKASNGKTELTLTQRGLGSAGSASGHESGWKSALNNLERHLAPTKE